MISFNIQSSREEEIAFRLGNIRKLAQQGLVDPEFGTISKQGQLLTLHCMKLTPPRNEKQGRDRTKADMLRIFNPLKLNGWRDKGLRDIIQSGNKVAWENASRHMSGDLARTSAVEPTEELHKRWRDPRGRGRKTRFVTLGPQRNALAALIKAAQARVGWAKAGWLRGYYALKGMRVDGWVAKHSTVRGQFVDGRNSPEMPYIEVANDTGWGRYKEENQRIINGAIRARAQAMKTYYEKMMEIAASGQQTPFQMQQAAIAEQFFG